MGPAQVVTPPAVAMEATRTPVTVWVAPVASTSRKPVGAPVEPPFVEQPVAWLTAASRHLSPAVTTGVTFAAMTQVEVRLTFAQSAWLARSGRVWEVTVATVVPGVTVVWASAAPGRRQRRSVALRSMGVDSARPGPPMQAPVDAGGAGLAAEWLAFLANVDPGRWST